MYRITGIILFLLIWATVFTGCSAEQSPAKIFFINLFYDVVDIRLGRQNQPVYEASAVYPFSYTPLAQTSRFGKYLLYFKPSAQDEWNSWSFNEQDTFCEVEPGRIYCIVITADGTLNYFSMTEKSGQGARVCFFNASHVPVAEMRISQHTLENRVASIQDLGSNMLSNFTAVPQGTYMLFWQFPFQKQKEEFLFYSRDQKSLPEGLSLLGDHYYVFCIYTENDAIKALFFDITPRPVPAR
jgi:hypothetical protein